MRKNQLGFAMLDVLLAVILICVASYGAYTMAKGYSTTASLRTLEQRATTIAQNYTPFLQDTSSSVLSGNELSVDFLTSIGIPTSALCTPDDSDSYVDSGAYYSSGGSTSASYLSFAQQVASNSASGGNYFVIGFPGNATQANQLAQDVGETFSVYYASGASASLDSATEITSLISGASTDTAAYSIFLIFPKISGKLDLTFSVPASPSCN